MRLILDKPIALLAHLVKQHLVRVRVPPEALAWTRDHSATVVKATPCVELDDPAVPVDLASRSHRVVLSTSKGDLGEVAVVAAVGPESLSEPMMLLVTSNEEIVIAVESDAAFRDDGVIQLRGAEKSVVLYRPEQIQAQKGRTLYRGAGVTGFRLEQRDDGGSWKPLPIEFNGKAVGLKEIRQE